MSNEALAERFSIAIDRSSDVVLVRCCGELVAGVTDILYAGVRPLIPDAKRVVLDLAELTYLDSMGLGAIMRLYISAKTSACDLALANVGKRVRQILGITDLLSVLSIIGENNLRMH